MLTMDARLNTLPRRPLRGIMADVEPQPTPADDSAATSRLRSYARQLEDLVDNSTALMYIKDTEGRYLFANRAFTDWLGIPAEDVLGNTNKDLFPPAAAAVYDRNDKVVLATVAPVEVEEPRPGRNTASSDPRWFLSIKFPLLDDDGVPYALGGITTDITDRKRAESEARKAREEAERANRSKDEFLSSMSHELRTPLNAILGFAQLLREQSLADEARAQVEHILRAGQHLLSLVNELLDLSWIQAGSPGMTVETVSATDAIRQALEIIRPLAAKQNIEVASDLHGALHRRIKADPLRLLQVFLNVLGNAVKFNRPDGYVRVSCRLDEPYLRFRITDTGSGLTEIDTGVLFRPFSRGSGAAGVEGSGLGLALSRHLVERMGGRLGLERTAKGEGSTFFIDTLMVPDDESKVDIPTFDSNTTALPQLSSATVLQIEDTYANRALIESVLGAMGDVRLYSASTGESGLAMADELHPDLVLLDLNLPDMSGADVLNLLRTRSADPAHPRPEVIVLSADASPVRIAELRSLGVTDYITKPVDVQRLATAVAKALGG